ncbi:MAG: CHAT domain-containing protein [Synergistaceae bacterium]|nr:CHAT domain-containing protein [Synergistaceae bacterium]
MTKQTENIARLFAVPLILVLVLFFAAHPGRAADSSDARFNEAAAAYQKQDFGTAAERFGQAGELYLKKGGTLKAAQSFFNRGLCLIYSARNEEAITALERAADIYGKAKDASGVSQSLLYAAQLYMDAMNWGAAQTRYERAMKAGSKDKLISALASEGLARIEREKGNLAAAETLFRQAEKLHQNNPGGALRVKLQMAYTIGLRGRETEALEMYDAVVKDASALLKKPETDDDGRRLVYYAAADKGQFLLRIGAFADAKRTMEEAMKLGEKVENAGGEYAEGPLALRTDYAQSLMYLGDFVTAAREFNELLGIAEGSDNTALSMKVNAALGTLSRMKGDDEAAFVFFTNFKTIAERANHVQSEGQALIQLAALYSGMGLWNEAAAYYQQAFYTALTAQDMDSAVRAMQGIYNGDLRNEMGLVGKVDYRTVQGLPWRSALTARFLRTKNRKPEHVDRGFDEVWRVVDSRRERQAIPSLEGFRAIREIALRGVPEVRDYYQEVKTSYAIADAVLRQAETDLSAARKAETALVGLAARKDEAHERQYADRAFSVTANLLRSLAGQALLTAPAREFSVRLDGLMLEAVSPGDAEPILTELEDDIKTLSRATDVISLKAADTEALQNSMTAGQLMPEDIKSRLRKAIFARAEKELKPEQLKEIVFRTLESTQPTLKKEMGSLARKEGKLYDYANDRIQKQQAALRAEAERIFPRVSPYMLVTIDSGGEMVRYVNAWRRMRLRSMILAELGIKIDRDKDWSKFLRGFGNAVRDAGKTFENTFAMNIDDAEATRETAARLRALAEKITAADLEDEGRNIGSILAAEGNISYDDRMSVLDLQARIRLAMSKFDAAEESARQILSMLPGEDVEAQPEKQWKAYGMLASIAAVRGDHAEASRLYDIAIDKLDSIHPIEGTTSQSASDRVSLYGGAVRSAFALWHESPSMEGVSRVWRVLEGMKSRHWREMLATTGGEFLNILPPEEREQVRELEAKRVELEAAYNRARFLGQMDEAAVHNEEIRTVLAKRRELTRGKTADVDTMPDVEAIREKLPPDWALADYFISPELSFAVLLKKTGEPAIIPLDVDYDALFGYSYWMRYANNNIGIAEYDEKKFFPISSGTDRAFVTACGLSPDDVGAMIFKPVAEACGDLRKLLVIPHDILYILPLEATQYQDSDGKPAYYVREWTFAELPSAFLLTRETGRPSADSSLMLVANPTYASLLGERTWMDYAGSLLLAAGVDPELERELTGRLGVSDLRAALTNAAPEDRQAITSKLAQYWGDIVEETSRDSRIASAVKSDFAVSMKPLDGSQAEAEDLEAMWKERGGDAPNILLAGSASEERFWDENPAKYRYVHIACHGYDRGSIPTLQPGLALSPIRDTKNDSFLQMGELAAVRWNADLITLSACETGLGELYIGDGMLGLSTSLLAGGAKGVVVTRWRASDESAPIFMRDFYSGVLNDKHPADALRTAQLSVLNGSDYRVPRHWAIFKYVGIPW